MAKKVFNHILSEPLHREKSAMVDIYTGTGNLTIDRHTGGEGLLASGSLEYLEKQDPPAWTVDRRDGQAVLTLKARGGRQPGFHLPWAACNGETNWLIHLNPAISSELTAHSGGGNVKLDLAGMAITQVSSESGGGNMDVVLPDQAANLSVMVKTGGGNVNVEIGKVTTGSNTVNAISGAGNVVISVPSGLPARIHANTGLGKVIVDPRFNKMDGNIYQSPDFENSIDKVEITAKSGAGNVSVNTK